MDLKHISKLNSLAYNTILNVPDETYHKAMTFFIKHYTGKNKHILNINTLIEHQKNLMLLKNASTIPIQNKFGCKSRIPKKYSSPT